MKNNYYIYITTNLLNGKKYIGKRHYSGEIEDDDYLGSGKILKNAIKKYGRSNFIKSILETCETETLCNEREQFWIREFNAVNSPMFYNIASGGDGGNTYAGLSPEELRRIHDIKSQKNKGKNNPRYQANVTTETREKLSAAVKRHYQKTGLSPTSGKFGALNKLSKKILCIELNQSFAGIRDASRIMNIPMPNIIRSLKSDGRYSAGKFDGKRLHWIYIKEINNEL